MSGQRKTLGRILSRLQQGAALSEFIVVLPALLLLGLGTLQTALIYHAKTTLNGNGVRSFIDASPHTWRETTRLNAIDRLNKSKKCGKTMDLIDVYHVEGELLTMVQDMGPVNVPYWTRNPLHPIDYVTVDAPSAPGERFALEPPDEQWIQTHMNDSIFLPDPFERAFALHGRDAILESLHQQSESLGCQQGYTSEP